MIYNGKRLKDVQIWKAIGRDEYLITFGPAYMARDHAVIDGAGALFSCCGEEERPTLCGTSVSVAYLSTSFRRVSWRNVPPRWQRAFTPYLNPEA